MRAVFSVLGLLLVVAVVGLLARRQLASAPAPPIPAGLSAPGAAAPAATPQAQVQQFRQAVQESLQQARPMPDDK